MTRDARTPLDPLADAPRFAGLPAAELRRLKQLHVLNTVADLRADVAAKQARFVLSLFFLFFPPLLLVTIAFYRSVHVAQERAVEIIGNFRRLWRDDLDDLELDLTFLGAPPPSR